MLKQQRIDRLNRKILEEYSEQKIVLGHGNINSSIILIGEAPGSNEVKLQKPFVGQAGKNFDEFLEILEIDREEVYITNVVKYRPTKKSLKTQGVINRTPTKKEIELFKGYLLEEIDIIKPKIIVPLGNTPLKALFQKEHKISEVHGTLFNISINEIDYNVYPLYHPAAVIYRRELRKVYVDDLKKLKKII
ncbi:uracil-DNA glycosylase [Anaerosalibacter sp. Marseille-P3206]|uniref:uracil-DNA glycosylase n=1 Tax=Anaerosalibacter sp. Marseille-P3206 TaxID=1871005 RepID=UPI001F2A39DA|nr:uracil-DNA glycosylase [Anaerosalibacter sp. Marseille-P3206]